MPYTPDVAPRMTADRRLARSLLREALAILGSKPPAQMPRNAKGQRWVRFWDRDRACAAMRAFFARHGRVPTGMEWRKARANDLPSQQIMLQLFASTADGVLAAGLTPVPKRNGRQRQ